MAITAEEQEQGLMFVNKLPPSMTFVYDRPKLNSFWMKNTPQPLDIIFCLNNKIVDFIEGEPYSTKILGGKSLSDLVIEMPRGSYKKMGMAIGEDIEIQYLPQTLSKIILINSLPFSYSF